MDAFRGFTIAAMLLVNNPGDWDHLYSQLAHAKWNGWTFTDWIFPFFLFIGGISMAFSLGRQADAGADKGALLHKLFKRAALIFLIGLLLNLFPQFDLSTVRIPGVLQRIALCTALAAPLVVYFTWRQLIAWIVGLLAFYSAAMLLVPVPDAHGVVGAGVLEPGRDFGSWLDRQFLGGHMWAAARTWDPEGLFTTIPALCSQLIGVLTGRWLLAPRNKAGQTVWMQLAGLAFLLAGAMLDVVLMPINKCLWSVSYCLLMSGWALLMFSVFYWLLDANPSRWLRARAQSAMLFFTIYGMNALFLFALSGLVAKTLMFTQVAGTGDAPRSLGAVLYAPLEALPLQPEAASLLHALLFNAAMFAIAWFMWRRRWFVKV
ncbi:Predicted acyltransferase [Pseudoduganella namucuonensis]|uniref:Predicted acyltransferase n=1 Tax=Pseudoduganella namucuonensis TaxID=1035707 RepID=A0A1I7IA76_9BURK|nr:Predicted acyltransferase [Pseudoduganella namucuonensis]